MSQLEETAETPQPGGKATVVGKQGAAPLVISCLWRYYYRHTVSTPRVQENPLDSLCNFSRKLPQNKKLKSNILL